VWAIHHTVEGLRSQKRKNEDDSEGLYTLTILRKMKNEKCENLHHK